MRTIGIIPARMASSRFPGKPLASICGIPMIGHVYFRSKMCKLLDEVYIATCDKEIVEYASSIGAEAIMTLDTHERASDRTAEALFKVEKDTGSKVDVVVMIQGDEPMLYPEMIASAVQPLVKDKNVNVVNLMAELKNPEEENDPNEIKVVVDRSGDAIYFSREPIPSKKKGKSDFHCLKQVCIIPFRRDFLIKFNDMEQTPLEIIESVDMLRLIENGYKVKMIFSKFDTYSVDTPNDLVSVEKKLKNDQLLKLYQKKG